MCGTLVTRLSPVASDLTTTTLDTGIGRTSAFSGGDGLAIWSLNWMLLIDTNGPIAPKCRP